MWLLVLVLFLSSVSVDCSGNEDTTLAELNIVTNRDELGKLTCRSDNSVSSKLTVLKRVRVAVQSNETFNKVICKNDKTNKANFNLDSQDFGKKDIYVGNNWNKIWSCEFYPKKEICDITVDIRNPEYAPYFKGNEKKLGTKAAKETDSFDSIATYEFFEGEQVNFICHRNDVKGLLTSIKLSSNAYGGIETGGIMAESVYLFLKLTQENSGNFIDCHAIYSYGAVQSYVTRIDLKYNKNKDFVPNNLPLQKNCEKPKNVESNNENCVEGFSQNFQTKNTLRLYKPTLNSLSILYAYDATETFDLSCDSGTRSDDSSINSTVSNLPSNKFTVKGNETTGNITCNTQEGERQKKIILIQKKRKVDFPTETSNIGSVSQDTGIILPPDQGSSEGDGPNLGVIVAIVVCALVFIAVVVFVIVTLIKRKPKSQEPDSNINYENLPEHNKGTPPIPSQWQEAQYCTPVDRIANNDYAVPFKPNVEEMYAKPIPKTQRLDKDNAAYASIDELNQTYTQVVPKHLRQGVAVLPTNRNSTYAELALKPSIAKKPKINNKKHAKPPTESTYVNSENPYQEVQINESPYVEVTFSEAPYADPNEIQAKGYVNVFKNSPYVNAEGKEDYAEPAYCEIGKLQ